MRINSYSIDETSGLYTVIREQLPPSICFPYEWERFTFDYVYSKH